MNEWLKNLMGKLKELWSKWKLIQKVIIIGVVVAIIIAIFATVKVSAKPTAVKLFNSQITDEVSLSRILDKLSEQGVDANTDSGYIYVSDAVTKRRMLAVLNESNLVPSNVNIWDDYFTRSWSTTDDDQNVKLGIKKQEELEKFINCYSDVDWSKVKINIPEKELFMADQNPVTCAVTISPKPNSSLLQDRNRLEGIQRAVLAAVEGLTAENLVITDVNGNQVNDFEGMADFDRLALTERTEKFKLKLASELRSKILPLFQGTYTEDRCRQLVVSIDMDTSEKTSSSTEILPIVIKKDNPDTPYDDSILEPYLPVSSQTVTREWQGIGHNPEGPSGVEGNNPPVYSDMSNVEGRSVETGVTQNNIFSKKETTEVTAPKIDTISVALNIDGKWKLKTDPKDPKKPLIGEDGHFQWEYIPVPQNELDQAVELIKGAINYDRERDNISVVSIPYDRDAEHQAIEDEYYAKKARTTMMIFVLASIAIVLVGFILFRIISRELERRRREREARLLAEQQAAREKALWDAKEEGMDVTMSVEETRRMELQENAITMAKEHPEDVALLIRTWLMEE